ncbi:MAG TPA: hypothetical protein VJ917_11000 [Saprospiraceae bacterium]|nr:hypothetical protein [Saprospiraceae bacterium]
MSLETLFHQKGTDKKSLQFILKALEKSNLEGFDYIEFIQAVERLKKLPMDESLAIRSAYSTVSTVGLTKEKLLDSANYYLDILNKEKKVFEQTVEDRRLVKIERQKRRIEALEKEVRQLRNKIKEMDDKIKDYRLEQENIQQNLHQEDEKITLTENAFDSTISTVMQRIEKDIQLIKKNI